mmetsp:Transcript_11633/g.17652  ORF Transcript_11633/g.17652 Transcript_11633/m.17652 type:complete len:201 (-) Transcript_11633:95-697(-)
MMSDDMSHTMKENALLDELKREAGISYFDSGNSTELETVHTADDTSAVEADDNKRKGKSRRLSVKDVADEFRCRSQVEPVPDRPYARLLLADEYVVHESVVWKRSGWSFKNRYLVLTNKPRVFYTTLQGHFKGQIPWSMTEPIGITKVDATHFDITVSNSSRVYHFNDKVKGSDKWVEVISELSNVWKAYLETNSAGRKK